ncbi:MAG: RNA polymerase sigma factor [Bacteroidetes bacterium]|nr:RNA polymerase sigma factor [Bacteroidota bacterium]
MTFEQLYKLHTDLVYNLALQYVQNTADAEEIAQDVFMSVHKNMHKFKGKSSVKTWIYRITINKSLDFIKAKTRTKRSFFFNSKRLDDPDTHINVSDFDHPGVLLEQKEEMKRIFDCINELPERQKTALILLKIENKTQQETANIMDCTVKSIESLYQRAKNKLTQKLAETKE